MLTGKHEKFSTSQRSTKVYPSTVTKGKNIAPWITKDFINRLSPFGFEDFPGFFFFEENNGQLHKEHRIEVYDRHA